MPKKSRSRRSKRGGFSMSDLNPFGSSDSSSTSSYTSSTTTSSPKSGWSDWFMGKKPETSTSYNAGYSMSGGYEPNMSQTRFSPSSIVGGRTRRRRRHKHGKSCRRAKSCRR